MSIKTENFSRYLPTDQQARAWGWRLLHAGRQIVRPQATYPDSKHPLNYLFDSTGSRTLDEFQIVYIAKGSGTFESRSHAKITVRSGDAILLFPNEWHRYSPNQETGWSEYWVGFHGKEAERIVAAFFSPKQPICQVGLSDALIHHFDQILYWLRQSIAAKEQILASHVPLALAFLKSGAKHENNANCKDSELVLQAKAAMLANIENHTDLEALAERLGVSYSRFRFAFKEQTGFSPRTFEIMIKLNRSRDMLLREHRSVTETAHALGYSSVYYFSRAFKKQFGQSPKQWLQEQKS